MFLVFPVFASCLIYSVDSGTDRIRIGVAAKGGEFSIQPTKTNKRSNLNAVAFDNERWYFGEDTVLASRDSVVRNPCQYLTRPEEFPLKGVHPVAACAIDIAGNIPNFVPKNDRVVGVVPTSATPQYRYAFADAIAAMNAQEPVLVEQSAAVASCYIMERLNRSVKGNHDILFVDIGAKQTEVSHWRLSTVNTLTTAELVNFRASDKVSGNAADKIVFEYLVKQIGKTNLGDDEQWHLLQVAKSVKEQLSSGLNVTLNMTEYNACFNVTKENVEHIFAPMMNILSEMVKSFKTPDQIELVGGSSRLLSVRDTVSNCFEDIPVKQSLNCEEAATMGAVYLEALRTKLFYGVKIQFNRTSLFGFTVSKNGKTRELIQSGSPLKPRVLTFIEKDNFPFALLTTCSDAVRAKIDTKDITQMKDSFITIDVDLRKIISSNEGRLGDETFVTNATFDFIPPLETYGLMSVKASNKIRGNIKIWPVDTDIRLTDPELSASDDELRAVRAAVTFFKSPKSKQTNSDKVKYLVESMRQRLKYDSDMQVVTTPEERIQLTEFLSEVEKNATESTNPRTLKLLLPRIEMKLRSPLLRADERKDRPSAIASLEVAIERAEEALPKATTDERAIERFTEFFELTKLWKQVAADVDPLTNPVITCKDIIRRANTLVNRIPDLFAPKRHVTHFRQPPPITPAPEPEPESETNAAKSDEL